jgi:hypothetical protein
MKHAIHLAVLCVAVTSTAWGAVELAPGSPTVGKNLQTLTTVVVKPMAPEPGLELTIASDDPKRLLLTKRPDQTGSASITVKVGHAFRESPEFWVQALADSGTATYTVTAAGCQPGKGTVKLAPAGFIIIGPVGAALFSTTSRAVPTRLTVKAMMLDASLKPVEEQMVARPVEVKVTSSDRKAGLTAEAPVLITPGSSFALAEFRPAGPGDTTLAANPPSGFSRPATSASITARVILPGLAITTRSFLGKDLQIGGVLSLGEVAPPEGLTVTLTSSDETRLLISTKATEVGKKSAEVKIAGGAVSGSYFLQGLVGSGEVEYTASAPGFRERTATLKLTPSGMMITPTAYGPPDEGEYLQPNVPEMPRKFLASVSTMTKVPLTVWTVQLDPVTKRGADITVQPLRAGLRVNVVVTNAKPEIGTFPSTVTIEGGSEHVQIPFVALKEGTTELVAGTPQGFTTPSNATRLTAFVRP